MTNPMEIRKLELSAGVLASEIVDGVTLQSVSTRIKAIQAFQQLVRSQLKLNHDYGIVPGTQKPTLLKPGAEKIAKLLQCSDEYQIIEKVELWDKPLFSYTVKCSLLTIPGRVIISEGLGQCNSMESKFRYRWVFDNQIPKNYLKDDLITKTGRGKNGPFTTYRIDNDDIFSQVNTLLKMAKKRALVDAALSAGRLSDLFAQDLEEHIDIDPEEKAAPVAPAPTPSPAPQEDDNLWPEEKAVGTTRQSATQSSGNAPNFNDRPANVAGLISEPQARRFYAIAKGAGIENPDEWLKTNYGYESSKHIPRSDYQAICTALEQGQ